MSSTEKGVAETAVAFSVHDSLRFEVTGSCRPAVDGIARDFWFFRAPRTEAPVLRLFLDERAPDYAALPPLTAAYFTPRNAVYREGPRRILDFGGRGLAILDEAADTFRVQSLDPDLAYEAAYLYLLSRIGRACETRGLVRLHALAVAVEERAVLVVLPMGGGKSTLGRALLADPSVRILSDDSPLIDPRGNALAFPLHLGLLGEPAPEIPPERVRRVERMEFGPKYLIDPEWFGDRIAPRAAPGLLVIGRRTLAREPHCRPAGYGETMRALVPAMILGLGLFQGLEYLLRAHTFELLGQAGALTRRSRNAHALARAAQRWIVSLGRDAEANASAIRNLASDMPGGAR
jgi:hypothetical protein